MDIGFVFNIKQPNNGYERLMGHMDIKQTMEYNGDKYIPKRKENSCGFTDYTGGY